MAVGLQMSCTECDFTIEAWSDGNPYYLDAKGVKRYAYHPSDELHLCTDVDTPHICLQCAHTFEVDSASPVHACPKCASEEISELWDLLNRRCPSCHKGDLIESGHMIS